METFDFHGLPIAFSHVGRGEPIVMLHNGGSSHAIWDEVAERLSDRYEIFALDLLGFGDSAKPGSGYRLGNYVRMLDEFLDAQGLSRARLVGNCMGCAISLAYSAENPGKVAGLVLCNPLTEATFLGGWLGPLLWTRERLPGLNRNVYKILGRLQLNNWIGAQATLFQLGRSGRQRKVHRNEAVCACYANRGQLESLLGVLDDLENYSVIDRLAPGNGFPPICTIWGLQNRILSPKAGCRLNATLRPQRQEWLPDCGHLLMLERPDEVAAIIGDFFASTASSES